MSTVEAGVGIRPFHFDVQEDDVEDLRRRIAATRWPEQETVADHSQGVRLATTRGATSPPGRNRRSSRTSCERRSGRCAERRSS
jgi:hypothetical protein